MATELAKAYIQIVPSMNGIQGSIQNTLGGEADKAGEKAGSSIVSKVKQAVIAAGIGKVFSAAINEGAALEQSLGGIETLYKSSAEKMKAYAKEAYKTSGISANAYMENVTSFSASLISSLGGDTDKAADIANRAMQDMSDNSNKFGTNIQDIQNAYQGFAKQNYTMLDNLKLGYGGTKEEMQRLLKDAEKLTGVKYDINNLSDVYTAIGAIQDNLGITGTTAKEAATTFSGSFNSMKAAAQDLLGNIAIGGDIKRPLQNLLSTASTFLFDNAIPMALNIVQGFGEALVTAIPQLAQKGYELLNGLVTGFVQNVPIVLPQMLQMIQDFATSLAEKAPEFIEMGFDLLSQFLDGIISAIPILIEYVPTIVTTFADIINNNFPTILAKGGELIMQLISGIIGTIPTLIANIPQIINAIASTIMAFQWLNIGKNIIQNIGNGIKGMISWVKNIAKSIVDGIKKSFSESTNVGVQLVKGLWNGIKSVKDWILNKIKGFGDSILGGIKSFFGIKSPSRVMAKEVGQYLPKGIAVGIEASADDVYDEMNRLSKGTLDIATDGMDYTYSSSSTNVDLYGLLQLIIKLLQMIASKDDTTVLNLNDREIARSLRKMGVVFE